MNKQGKSPTMKDVAREAGVALGTVSKVFNGIPVGRSYRERVEAAAEKLGYSVNSYARGLRASKTNTIALILPGLDHTFFSELANCVSSELTKRDYRMVLATTQFDVQAEARCIQMVRQNKVDGIIALTYAPDLQINDDLPYVSIDRYLSPSIPCVSSDNFSGGALAANKLIELGCKKPLFLRIGSQVIGETDKRGAGFTAACEMKGADFTAQRFNDEDGMEAIYRFLDEHVSDGRLEYDGIFCSTDRLAFYVINHLKHLGIRVPEDVQIIGYDGIINYATRRIDCSTITQPIGQMAETAVELLLSSEQRALGANICLPVQYVSGGTTKDTPKEA